MTTLLNKNEVTPKDYFLYAQIWFAAGAASGKLAMLGGALIFSFLGMFILYLEEKKKTNE